MLNLVYKKTVHQACLNHVSKSLSIYQKGIEDAQYSLQSESKSSAGDKHETGRAMLQLEAEKLGAQYQTTLQSLNFIKQLDYTIPHQVVQLGSLVETNMGLFYICSGLGSIQVENTKLFVISPMAPLSKIMINKAVNDQFTFNGKPITINSLI